MRDDNYRQQWDKFIGAIDRRQFLVTSLAAGVATLAPRYARADAERFRLGLILSATGPGSNYCESAIQAVTYGVAELNKRGGLLGKHPVELVFRDEQSKPEAAAREARDLIDRQKVHAIIGTWSSASALAVQEIAYEQKVLHISACGNSSQLIAENYSPYTFLVTPNSQMESAAIAVTLAQMAKDKNWKRFVTIGQDYEWGRAQQKGFIEVFMQRTSGVELTKEFWFKLGETNFAPYIAAIMASQPDFCFGAMSAKDSATFMLQAKANGMFRKVVYPGGLITVADMQQQAKTLERGLIGVTRAPFFALLDEPVMQRYIKLHQDNNGPKAYPTDWACMHLDALYAIEQAANRSGRIDSESLRKALTGATIDTCRGPAAFAACSNQLAIPAGFVGTITDTPDYPFPIYDPKTLVRVDAKEVERSCAEIEAVRKKRI